MNESNGVICTLFEGNYHYGLGALVNSLYQNGFRGVIWAGYRGDLPPWASNTKDCDDYREYFVAEGCVIRFVPVHTEYHLTNYKPFFILEIWSKFCPDTPSIYYFDPDIILKDTWSFFPKWVDFGIALCEDMCSPMLKTHPVRLHWRQIALQYGWDLTEQSDRYINAGFIGITRERQQIIRDWITMLEVVEQYTGSLSSLATGDRTHPFCFMDQDALNMCLMMRPRQYSIIGREGMSFAPRGLELMAHAVGNPKPWQKRYFRASLSGNAPSQIDKLFYKFVSYPICLFSLSERRLRTLDLRLASALGRFIRRQ